MSRRLMKDYLQDSVENADLALILETLSRCCAQISRRVRLGAMGGVLGATTHENVQGEVQQALDVIANEMMVNSLKALPCVAGLASEEMETIVPTGQANGRYLVLFDPLDGSSNINVNVSIGTIFSILRMPEGAELHLDAFLQAGHQQVAAGYALYGPQTVMVMSTGSGVQGFTLHPEEEAWYLTHPRYDIPTETQEFAINMSNMRHWQPGIRQYIQDALAGETGCLGKNYNMRWIASMVADVHRILTRGGVFMYPWDARKPEQPFKLRLLYEANPMSFLVTQAGGRAINTEQAILDVQPTALHQRVSVVLGSAREIDRIESYCQQYDQA